MCQSVVWDDQSPGPSSQCMGRVISGIKDCVSVCVSVL